MTQSRVCVYNPVQIAECGGPCEQDGPEFCDCGALRAVSHAASDLLCGMKHPQFAEENGGIEALTGELSRLVDQYELGPRPVPGVDIPDEDGMCGDLTDLCRAQGVDPRIGVPLLERARGAWVSSLPPNGWLPIETAPAVRLPFKMFVVIAMGVKVTESSPPYTSDPYCVWKDPEGSFARWPHPFEPTHWLPLPPYQS